MKEVLAATNNSKPIKGGTRIESPPSPLIAKDNPGKTIVDNNSNNPSAIADKDYPNYKNNNNSNNPSAIADKDYPNYKNNNNSNNPSAIADKDYPNYKNNNNSNNPSAIADKDYPNYKNNNNSNNPSAIADKDYPNYKNNNNSNNPSAIADKDYPNYKNNNNNSRSIFTIKEDLEQSYKDYNNNNNPYNSNTTKDRVGLPRQYIVQLTREQFEKLDSLCKRYVVSKDTSQIEIGFIAGQRSVLEMLNRGFTCE